MSSARQELVEALSARGFKDWTGLEDASTRWMAFSVKEWDESVLKRSLNDLHEVMCRISMNQEQADTYTGMLRSMATIFTTEKGSLVALVKTDLFFLGMFVLLHPEVDWVPFARSYEKAILSQIRARKAPRTNLYKEYKAKKQNGNHYSRCKRNTLLTRLEKQMIESKCLVLKKVLKGEKPQVIVAKRKVQHIDPEENLFGKHQLIKKAAAQQTHKAKSPLPKKIKVVSYGLKK